MGNEAESHAIFSNMQFSVLFFLFRLKFPNIKSTSMAQLLADELRAIVNIFLLLKVCKKKKKFANR